MTRILAALLVLASALLAGCPSDPEPDPLPVLEPPPEGQGFQLSFTGVVVEPYSEVWTCSVYPIPIDEAANVSWVETLNNEGMHHLTLSTLGLSESDLEPGVWPCEELYGDSSLMQDQIMFFGNQGTGEDEMHLPQGVAATLPSTIDIIHELHFVNVSDQPVELYSYINAWTVPDSVVEDGIWGGSVRDEHINIPANSEHTEWSRCVFNRDVEVHFLASHTHALGVEFTIAGFDGVDVGEVFYSNDDWHVPEIVQYDPPLVIPEGAGFEWACTWDNPNDHPVNYGLTSEDEMCNLAVVHTPFDITAACDVVETSDGVLWDGTR